jgi:hypothetical protein
MVLRLKTRESRSLPGLPNATVITHAPKKLQTFWISCMRKQNHLLKTAYTSIKKAAPLRRRACGLLLLQNTMRKRILTSKSTTFGKTPIWWRGVEQHPSGSAKALFAFEAGQTEKSGLQPVHPQGRARGWTNDRRRLCRILVARGGAAR